MKSVNVDDKKKKLSNQARNYIKDILEHKESFRSTKRNNGEKTLIEFKKTFHTPA